MSKDSSIKLPHGCRVIDFPKFEDDRGALSFVEGVNHIPFHIERVFWMYGMPGDKTRGGHSHIECSQVLVPVTGSFRLLIDDGTDKAEILMDSASRGILLPPGIWCELRDFAPNTSVMVLTSHPFRTEDYVLDHPEYSNNKVMAVPYEPAHREIWNRFVKSSKNGTFLMDRGYMDYHSDRFTDCSLMFYKKGALLALLPANWVKDESTVQSHGGLTYGGLITGANFTAEDALEVFRCAIEWMKKNLGAVRWIYKPVPRIYSSLPADEDLYALSQNGAIIKKREISSIVDLSKRIPLSTLRKRGYKKATRNSLAVVEGNFEKDIEDYWNILSELLRDKYDSKPVHTLDEIRLLQSRFPDSIRLYVVKDADQIIAGTVIYDTGTVVKTQYIASSVKGKELGALDLLFGTLMDDVFKSRSFMDYGTSTLVGGTNLNEGLISQKEGFGARAVVYDTYEMLF
ncbi:MAG: GNAT family N-acetyltransferase [Bacteroidaceae bacterium]|jgi:hypothetical protein|nr:GNAT family N-acetyltransferase [Bacteroidaceae bacterium]